MPDLLLSSASMNESPTEIWRYAVVTIGNNRIGTQNTGFVMNQQITNIDYKQISQIYKVPQLPACPIYCGGPVNTDRVTIIHSTDFSNTNTQRINEHCSITFNKDIVTKLRQGQGPKHWKCIIGFSVWQDGQLDAEMQRRGGWMTHPWTDTVWSNYKMKNQLWKRIVRRDAESKANLFLDTVFDTQSS